MSKMKTECSFLRWCLWWYWWDFLGLNWSLLKISRWIFSKIRMLLFNITILKIKIAVTFYRDLDDTFFILVTFIKITTLFWSRDTFEDRGIFQDHTHLPTSRSGLLRFLRWLLFNQLSSVHFLTFSRPGSTPLKEKIKIKNQPLLYQRSSSRW